MLRYRDRAVGVAAIGALAVLLSACGSATAPELATTPDSQGTVLAPPTVVVPPTSSTPPAPPPTTSATPPPTTSSGPTTKAVRPTPKPSGQAVPQAAHQSTPAVAWVPAGGDEFSGSTLDTGAWNPYTSVGAFGTGRRVPEAITQSGGILTITGRARDGDGTSGGMGFSKGQVYGRWEFRARTSKGAGFGSAILLWPDSEQFPKDGELDMMEVPSPDRSLAHTVVHWSTTGSDDNVIGGTHGGDFSQWHTFALEWLPDRVTWFVDGVKRFETTDKKIIPTVPMHPTIQLDQGPKADWIPAADDSTPDEVTLEVDYLRVSEAPARLA